MMLPCPSNKMQFHLKVDGLKSVFSGSFITRTTMEGAKASTAVEHRLYVSAESVVSETTQEGRILFGCERQFLADHEANLKDIFCLKR